VPQIKAATDLFEDTDENHEQHRNSRCLAWYRKQAPPMHEPTASTKDREFDLLSY
jgi:hypothetical protein